MAINQLFVRYISGKDDYCIHGMLMSSECTACEQMRLEEIKEMNKPKMTREEAERKLYPHKWGTEKRKEFLDGLEALGLIKFDEVKSPGPSTLMQLDNDGNIKWCAPELSKAIGAKYGTCRLEIWPEGLVLWVGGEIVWRSWSIAANKVIWPKVATEKLMSADYTRHPHMKDKGAG